MRLPLPLLSRLELAEEEIEGFDKNKFVSEVIADELEALEKRNGKVVDYKVEVDYLNDETI